MKHLSLFSGIGGLDLAAEMAGFTTVGQVEIDDYCNRVLEYHWPGVPRWRDVKDVTAETFEQKTGIKPGTLAVLSGGFPCQPVSCAGKRKGDTDERWLWDEMLRVICEIRPRWVLAENVRGLLSARSLLDGRHLFGRVLRDLAQNGYCAGWLCYGAGDVGAPHKRERVFIVAHSRGGGFGKQGICREQQRGAEAISTSEGSCWLVADTNNPGSRTPYGGTNENRSEEVKERGEQPQSRPCRFSQDVADAESRQDNRREPGELAEKAEAGASCNPAVNPGSQDAAHTCREGLEIGQCVSRNFKQEQQTAKRGCKELADAYGHNRQRGGGNVQVGRLGSKERVEQNDTAGRNERPTQSGLGNPPDGLPSGLAGHRWPAGWWPTPTASDPEGGVIKNVQFDGNSWYRENRHGVRWGIKLKDAIEGWPAGPGEQYPWEPPRIATGVKDRVAKLKALGNAVVPAQAYPIFRAIMEIEEAIP